MLIGVTWFIHYGAVNGALAAEKMEQTLDKNSTFYVFLGYKNMMALNKRTFKRNGKN